MARPINSIDDVHALGAVLYKDVLDCLAALTKKDTPVRRRHLVRAAFAQIEGLTFGLKQLALLIGNKRGNQYLGTVALLLEEGYDLSDKGELRIRSARLQLPSNIRFAFTQLAHAAASQYQLALDGKGWPALRTSLKVRDRLMHPKAASDLEVSDRELLQLQLAQTWFTRESNKLLESVQLPRRARKRAVRNRTDRGTA